MRVNDVANWNLFLSEVIYLTCTLAITTMSMVLTVFVLNLYGISDRPVPRWIKSLLLTCRTRRRSLSQSYRDPTTTMAARDKRLQTGPSVLRSFLPCERRAGGGGSGAEGLCLGNRRRQREPEAGVDEAAAIIEMNRHHVTAAAGQSEMAEDVATGNEVRFASAVVESATSSSMATTMAAVDDVTTKSDADYSKDWKRVAEIFDRFFFWLFLFAVILSTVVLFHPLIKIGLSH